MVQLSYASVKTYLKYCDQFWRHILRSILTSCRESREEPGWEKDWRPHPKLKVFSLKEGQSMIMIFKYLKAYGKEGLGLLFLALESRSRNSVWTLERQRDFIPI